MEGFEWDGTEEMEAEDLKPARPERNSIADEIEARQKPFMALIAKFHDLFWDLPKVTTRDVDARLAAMFEDLMDAAGAVGISRMSVPRLKECCGKKREWPGEAPPHEEKLGWGVGDIFRRITRFFGFGHCEACERRRKLLNRIFGLGR